MIKMNNTLKLAGKLIAKLKSVQNSCEEIRLLITLDAVALHNFIKYEQRHYSVTNCRVEGRIKCSREKITNIS